MPVSLRQSLLAPDRHKCQQGREANFILRLKSRRNTTATSPTAPCFLSFLSASQNEFNKRDKLPAKSPWNDFAACLKQHDVNSLVGMEGVEVLQREKHIVLFGMEQSGLIVSHRVYSRMGVLVQWEMVVGRCSRLPCRGTVSLTHGSCWMGWGWTCLLRVETASWSGTAPSKALQAGFPLTLLNTHLRLQMELSLGLHLTQIPP